MANMKIEAIEGIGSSYGEKLVEIGIKDSDTLLKTCCTPKGRKDVVAKSGISNKLVLKWTNMADLFRINGVGPEFAELLESAGVDTVKELRTRNAENLAEKMAEVNEVKKLTRRKPTVTIVTDWVNQAKELAPVVEH